MARNPLLTVAAVAFVAAVTFVAALPLEASAGITEVVKCQKKFAGAGANFAKKVIKLTLKCTTEVAECQISCEEGLFGPPCATNPPPCCDPEDPGSNAGYQACLDDAQDVCDLQETKIDIEEIKKQNKITAACTALSIDELCGAQTAGLGFAALNAGCLALDPSYTCTLPNLVECVGGPLQRKLLDQMSGVLSPRAGEAVALLGLQSVFPDLPVVTKVVDALPAGLMDVWSIAGNAGDEVSVRIVTRDDNGNGTSNLHPGLVLFDLDNTTPLDNTDIRDTQCPVPNVCGSTCPQLTRTLPFDGTFLMAVEALPTVPCVGGSYRLVVQSPNGAVPVLVQNDVPIAILPSPSGAFLDGTTSALD
jgi:hypothetical protein